MGKTLQVLENLKRVQEKERESIARMHKENLERLNSDITQLYSSSLSQMKKDIEKYNSETLKEIKKQLSNINQQIEWCQEEKLWNWAIWGGIAGAITMTAIFYAFLKMPFTQQGMVNLINSILK